MNPLTGLGVLAATAAVSLMGAPANAASPNLKPLAIPVSALPDGWVVGGAMGIPGDSVGKPNHGISTFTRILTPASKGAKDGSLVFVAEVLLFAPNDPDTAFAGFGRDVRTRALKESAANDLHNLFLATVLLPPSWKPPRHRSLAVGDEGHELVFTGTSSCCQYGGATLYVRSGNYFVIVMIGSLAPVEPSFALELARAALAPLPPH